MRFKLDSCLLVNGYFGEMLLTYSKLCLFSYNSYINTSVYLHGYML